MNDFVHQLKAETGDPATAIEAVRPLLQNMADDTSWVKPAYYH